MVLSHLGQAWTLGSPIGIAKWLREELRVAEGRKTGELDTGLTQVQVEIRDAVGKTVKTEVLNVPEASKGFETVFTLRFAVEGDAYTGADVECLSGLIWKGVKERAQYIDPDRNLLEEIAGLGEQ